MGWISFGLFTLSIIIFITLSFITQNCLAAHRMIRFKVKGYINTAEAFFPDDEEARMEWIIESIREELWWFIPFRRFLTSDIIYREASGAITAREKYLSAIAGRVDFDYMPEAQAMTDPE